MRITHYLTLNNGLLYLIYRMLKEDYQFYSKIFIIANNEVTTLLSRLGIIFAVKPKSEAHSHLHHK